MILILFGAQSFAAEIFWIGRMPAKNCPGPDKIRPELKQDNTANNKTKSLLIRAGGALNLACMETEHPCKATNHTSKASLHACWTREHASKVSLHACWAKEHPSKVSLHACLTKGHASKVYLYACWTKEHASKVSLHACWTREHASKASLQVRKAVKNSQFNGQ